MLILGLTVAAVVLTSFLCSMIEAAIYAVPWTTIEKLRKSSSRSGQVLFDLRSNIDKPITAVLTLNTVANTAGSAFAGALAANVLGSNLTGVFAAILTLIILLLGEIIPKTLGVVYAEKIAVFFAIPLKMMVSAFTPIIYASGFIIRLITPQNQSGPQATEEDIKAITNISHNSGKIKDYEAVAIANVLALDQKQVSDVLTPRTVVYSLSKDATVSEAYEKGKGWKFSRVPVYGDNNEDIVGIVYSRDIVQKIINNEPEVKISELMHKAKFILEGQGLDKALMEFLKSRQHLFVVLDEYGGLAGVISLEDILEEMLGQEIVDEKDTVTDMREHARKNKEEKINNEEK